MNAESLYKISGAVIGAGGRGVDFLRIRELKYFSSAN
jgi:hypothetical protein